jgi:hypothetical protein
VGSSEPEPALGLKYLIKKVFYKNFVKIYDHVKNHGVEKGLNSESESTFPKPHVLVLCFLRSLWQDDLFIDI